MGLMRQHREFRCGVCIEKKIHRKALSMLRNLYPRSSVLQMYSVETDDLGRSFGTVPLHGDEVTYLRTRLNAT